jgi:hypothetical protein
MQQDKQTSGIFQSLGEISLETPAQSMEVQKDIRYKRLVDLNEITDQVNTIVTIDIKV